MELGAGLGLPSVVAAKRLGVGVVATDGDPGTVELLRQNAARNFDDPAENGAGTKKKRTGGLRVAALVWGGDAAAAAAGGDGGRALRTELGLTRAPDVVLAADVVYGSDPARWGELVATLGALCEGGQTLALLANMQRRPLTDPLSEAAQLGRLLRARGFAIARVPPADLHPDARGSGGQGGANSCCLLACRLVRPLAPLPAAAGRKEKKKAKKKAKKAKKKEKKEKKEKKKKRERENDGAGQAEEKKRRKEDKEKKKAKKKQAGSRPPDVKTKSRE